MSHPSLSDLLARWQAFSQMQRRALAFLAAEALATGQDFENSTEGATRALSRLGQFAGESLGGELQESTNAVVHRLQTADRSRQGLEQVAAVLTALGRLQGELERLTRQATENAPPPAGATAREWTEALGRDVTLADWRHRLMDALDGQGWQQADSGDGDVELF